MVEPTLYEQEEASPAGAVQLAGAESVLRAHEQIEHAIAEVGAERICQLAGITPERLAEIRASEGNVKVSTLAKIVRCAGERVPIVPVGADWAARTVTAEQRDKAAEAMALVDDYDGCFERVRDWEALEQWDRDAHPDSHPHSDYEDCDWWRKRADAALDALGLTVEEDR